MAAPPPGRRGQTDRGQRRRNALLEAAAELIISEGFAGVSHRSLAERTGLPLAATTYYFSSLDEILQQAVEHLARRWRTQAEAALDRLPDTLSGPDELARAALAVTLAAVAEQPCPIGGADGGPAGVGAPTAAHAALLTTYERYVQAGRSQGLRALLTAYDSELDELLVRVLAKGPGAADQATARLLLAQIDGAALRALAEGEDPVVSARHAARTLLELLLRSPRPSQIPIERVT